MAEETTDTKKKEIQAKPTSLIGQIVAALWVAGWSAYKFLKSGEIEVNDVILSGVSIVACFSPVYFSIMLDKIKEIKLCK